MYISTFQMCQMLIVLDFIYDLQFKFFNDIEQQQYIYYICIRNV